MIMNIVDFKNFFDDIFKQKFYKKDNTNGCNGLKNGCK